MKMNTATAFIKVTDATGKKGPSVTLLEDVEPAKAFVATSEDSVVGSNQKSANFEAKMMANHNILAETHNQHHTKQHVRRNNENSLHRKFKHLSRLTLETLGVKETMGELAPGDTDREKFNKMIKQTWVERDQGDSQHADVVWVCLVVLRKHTKWHKFQSDEGAVDEQNRKREAKQTRPLGAKNAKATAADRQLIQNPVTAVSEGAKSANAASTERVSILIDVMTKSKASE